MVDMDLISRWVKALRSDEYKQTHGRLKDDDGAFCCLGVLCQVAGWEILGSNSIWMNQQDVDYQPFIELLGMEFMNDLYSRNDGNRPTSGGAQYHPHTFAEIADVIEKKYGLKT